MPGSLGISAVVAAGATAGTATSEVVRALAALAKLPPWLREGHDCVVAEASTSDWREGIITTVNATAGFVEGRYVDDGGRWYVSWSNLGKFGRQYPPVSNCVEENYWGGWTH